MTQESLQFQINDVIQTHISGNTDEAIRGIKSLINSHPKEPILFNICGVLTSK